MNYWQGHVRRSVYIVKYRLMRDLKLAVQPLFMSSIWVSIVHRETATGHVNSDSMAFQKDVTCGEQFDFISKHFSGLEKFRGIVYPLPEPRSNYALGEIPSCSVWFNVQQPHNEVCIGSGC